MKYEPAMVFILGVRRTAGGRDEGAGTGDELGEGVGAELLARLALDLDVDFADALLLLAGALAQAAVERVEGDRSWAASGPPPLRSPGETVAAVHVLNRLR
jgi:hypothetical protein